MLTTLDFADRSVCVVGERRAARRVVARYRHAGAVVTLVDLAALPTVVPPAPGAAGTGHSYPDATRSGLASDVPLVGSCLVVAAPATDDAWRELLMGADLLVDVSSPAALASSLESIAIDLRLWRVVETPASTAPRGRVTLIGAGPGPDDLLTLRALDALASADVVFFDRLGPSDRLPEWAPGARHVDVGKTPGYHAVPQSRIEELLIDAALAGETVVRLKGGDPFVFGRGGEEVLACRAAGVEVEVVPGISSSIAVPAAAGIPVTHREVSRIFSVVSGHAPFSDNELEHLVGLSGTIVVLMGVATLPHLAAGLVRHGLDARTPVAVVESGLSSSQRTTMAPLGSITARAIELGVRSPAVVVIGEVVRLACGDDADAMAELSRVATMAGP
jgi:uroporphyrin-III C-methyltransferase